jgi:alanine racemase
VALLRSRIRPNVRLMAAVKADAYGHGLTWTVTSLLAVGVDAFAVATAAEALAVRALAPTALVFLLAPVRTRIAALLEADIDLSVATSDDLAAVAQAHPGGAPARLHVKADTGMGRLGQPPAAALTLALAVARRSDMQLQGVWTHLASADEGCGTEPDGATAAALEQFDELVAGLERHDLRPPFVHAANSAATLRYRAAHHDLVRPGIALYGHPPSAAMATEGTLLQPVMRLDGPITFVKRVAPGTPLSYGGSWRAVRETVVATVRCGYADGYPRSLSSCGVAGFRGRQVAVIGRVCMDQLLVDLGPDTCAEVGERIALIGGDAPSASEVAAAAGSFVYELLTGIGARVERVPSEG